MEFVVPAHSEEEIGWISVGWSNTGMMQGSDLVFGYRPSGGDDACIRSVAFVDLPDPGPNQPGSFNVS